MCACVCVHVCIHACVCDEEGFYPEYPVSVFCNTEGALFVYTFQFPAHQSSNLQATL